jgi:hypothetical protein
VTTNSGTVLTPGGKSPTGVFEGIGAPLQTGDTEMGGAGGIEVANGMVEIESITCATTALVMAAELLEGNENGMMLRSRVPQASRAPSDCISKMYLSHW